MAFLSAAALHANKANLGSLRKPLSCRRARGHGANSVTVRAVPRMIANLDTGPSEQSVSSFSARGMKVDEFFEQSIGEWRSQRSSHNLAFTQFEQITSEILIERLASDNEELRELCVANKVAEGEPFFGLKMQWEGESDWDDENEVSEGESVMAVIKDGEDHGRLLRSVGYAETIPAVGEWRMTEEGVFVLKTFYEMAAAEERIWFATPNLRMRVSSVLTSSGMGVTTASFSTEIRRLQL